MAGVKKDPVMAPFYLHFKKWKVSLERCRVIYDMAIESIAYEKAATQQEAKQHLLKMEEYNEQEFDIIRKNYLDVNPIKETGMQLCMIPNHEMRRVIHNLLEPEHADPEPIYLDVASLGWMWF